MRDCPALCQQLLAIVDREPGGQRTSTYIQSQMSFYSSFYLKLSNKNKNKNANLRLMFVNVPLVSVAAQQTAIITNTELQPPSPPQTSSACFSQPGGLPVSGTVVYKLFTVDRCVCMLTCVLQSQYSAPRSDADCHDKQHEGDNNTTWRTPGRGLYPRQQRQPLAATLDGSA